MRTILLIAIAAVLGLGAAAWAGDGAISGVNPGAYGGPVASSGSGGAADSTALRRRPLPPERTQSRRAAATEAVDSMARLP
jgi:hypothetical protein